MTNIQSKPASSPTVARRNTLGSSKDTRGVKDAEPTATPSPTFDKPNLPTRATSSKVSSADKKVRPRSQGAGSASAEDPIGQLRQRRPSTSSADQQAVAAESASSLAATTDASPARKATAVAKKPSKTSSHGFNPKALRDTVVNTAVLWLCAGGWMVRPAKADLLTLSVQGGYSGISQYINDSLNSTLGSHSQEKLHTVSVSTSFPFARNLVGLGPDGTMVMSSPEAAGSRAEPQRQIQGFLKEKGIPYTEMPHNVNMADVHYDPDLDLLIVAHTAEKGTRCESTSLTPGCTDKLASVITAFGKPKNIVELVKNPDLRGSDGFAKCYDLDIFFHLTTNPAGKKVALIYQPCTVRVPAMIGMSQDMSTKNMMRMFKKLGIDAIDLSPDDFNRLAANAVSLEPGKLVFSGDVSDKLKEELRDLDMEPIVPEKPFSVIDQPGQDNYALHCVTANIPNWGYTAEDVALSKQRRNDPIVVEVTPTPLTTGPTISSGDGPQEGVKPGALFDLGVAAGIASAVASGIALVNRAVQAVSPTAPTVQAGLDAELLGSTVGPQRKEADNRFGTLNTAPAVRPDPTVRPRVIDARPSPDDSKPSSAGWLKTDSGNAG